MQKGIYILKTPNNTKLASLEISDEVLNELFVEAACIIEILIYGIRIRFGGHMLRQRLNTNPNHLFYLTRRSNGSQKVLSGYCFS